MAQPEPTDDEHQPLTTVQKLLYASGHFGLSALSFPLIAWLGPFYNPGEARLDAGKTVYIAYAGLVGVMVAIGRVTDAINDPLVGFLSDRLRTRWGRRKPFMVLSILPFVGLFVAVWHPPFDTHSGGNFTYGLFVLLLLFVAFTAYAAPYLALLPELAGTQRERVSLATWQGAFNVGGTIVASGLGGKLIDRFDYPATALTLAAAAFVSLCLPCLGPRERTRPKPSAYGFRQALLLTLRNRPLLLYLAGYLGFWTGLLVLAANLEYIAQSLLGLDKQGAGSYFAGVPLAVGGLCLPIAPRVAARMGPKRMMAAATAAFAVVAMLLGTVGLVGDQSFRIWHLSVLCVLAGPAVAALFAIPYVILAAITDADERASGERREAMFFGVQGLVLKAGYGLAALIAYLLLQWFGQTTEQPHGLHLTGPAAAGVAVAGLLVFRRFPADLTAGASAEEAAP
ncbi:MAG: MFS transporter [Armatimonadota bacterium]